MDGLLLVDKPVGWSSMDVVRRVRRAAGGAKTGHAGTLDPLASGLLILCLGRATKMISALMDLKKVYRAEVDLSGRSATDDLEGPVEPVACPVCPDEAGVRSALEGFVGWIDQSPPVYSAVHVQGRRAYQLARKGRGVIPPPRKVFIEEIELQEYAWPRVTLTMVCGKGTYVRSLARDLGVRLNTGGYLTGLRREGTGPFSVQEAVAVQKISGCIGEKDLIDCESVIKLIDKSGEMGWRGSNFN